MKTKQMRLIALSMLTLAITSCKKNNPEPNDNNSFTVYTNGVFISNEGPFGSGSGSVSFYSRDSAKIFNDIFLTLNKYPLGNIVQSVEVHNSKAYIVVNNAGKVVVANATSFASLGQIDNLHFPRYFLGINATKGYVSEYGADGMTGAVKVINLSTNSISDSIPTGKGPNKMVQAGNYVYVACNGGYGTDSVITVIDATTNTVIKNITTAINPSELVIDANGNIWVLCLGKWDAGYTALEKTGALVKINGVTHNIEQTLTFSSLYSQPSGLCINSAKNKLYYNYNGGVYVQTISSPSLSIAPVVNRNFYGLGVDSSNDVIFAADAGDYTSSGQVLRYTSSGAVIDSFTVGVIPNGFYFY